MSFELGAKKAGLNLIRAFLHSVDGVRPYYPPHPAPSARPSSAATASSTSSRPTRTARSSAPAVPPSPLSRHQLGRRLPLPRRQQVIQPNTNQYPTRTPLYHPTFPTPQPYFPPRLPALLMYSPVAHRNQWECPSGLGLRKGLRFSRKSLNSPVSSRGWVCPLAPRAALLTLR